MMTLVLIISSLSRGLLLYLDASKALCSDLVLLVFFCNLDSIALMVGIAPRKMAVGPQLLDDMFAGIGMLTILAHLDVAVLTLIFFMEPRGYVGVI